MEQPDRAGSSEDCSTSVSQKVQVQHVQQQQQHMQQMQPPEEHLLEEQRLEGMQQQHQQEAQIQRLQASRQDSIRVGEDFLDCEDASSSGSEGSGEAYSEEEEGCSTAGDGDELPLININSPAWVPDHTFKVLLVGDSGVGKTCLVMRFIADKFETHLPSTVGVDFAIKRMVVGDRNIKLTIWDTAGQERFRALTSTFYRGAVGIIFVFDVTRRETLSSLSGSWMEELQSYDPHPEVARMVVANKVDQHDRREVTWQEGADFAQQHGCLFVETSAKHNIAVGVAFEELVLRILDTPALLAAVQAEDNKGRSLNLAAAQPPASGMAISCSC